MKCVIDFPVPGHLPARRVFDSPLEVVRANTLDEVLPALSRLEAAQAAGRYCVGFIAFDAAPAFDPALSSQRDHGVPLLAFGVYEQCVRISSHPPPAPLPAAWSLNVPRADFTEIIEHLREEIRNGVAYQVNFTLRAESTLPAEHFAYYEQLRRAQGAAYCAYLELDDLRVLSASPELFFSMESGVITTRPMKGTAPRGRWPEEDDQLKDALYRSEKERAENLMIVDLLRNDLSRVSVNHGVRVNALFDIERYPTLFQMTSTVEARLREGVGLTEVLRALFPCGSVTGAPKVKAMERIAELEGSPRGLYCGAIGVLEPHRSVFNVAIRTVVIDAASGRAVCGLGSGITFDSSAEREYDEVQVKSRFLDAAPEPFELLETLLFDGKDFWLRERHLERLLRSAGHFGFTLDRNRIEHALDAWRLAAEPLKARVRLLVSADGTPRIESTVLQDTEPRDNPVVVPIARKPMTASNTFLFHKTTQRDEYESRAQEHPEAFDVLLWNERGEVTEFTRGNLVAEIDGKRVTPPLESGLLGGTFREELLHRGEIEERVLSLEDIQAARKIWFVNSVRGWVEVMLDSFDTLSGGEDKPGA